MRLEAWVTSAMEDGNVDKALVLAGSLRRVRTSKKLVVLTNLGVSQSLREQLKKMFDLVIPLGLEGKCSKGLDPEDYAKIEALSLVLFYKCVYLSPNMVVFKNCDEIFKKYDNVAVMEKGDGGGLDSSIFLYSPSIDHAEALGKIMRNGNREGFEKGFELWIKNNIQNWEKLGMEYNAHLNLKAGSSISLSSDVAIANFGNEHPFDLTHGGGSEHFIGSWGTVEKAAFSMCQTILKEDIRRELNVSGTSVQPRQLERYNSEPIAIVGMSFRLPGCNNEEEFWDLLSNGKEAIAPLPEYRWTREQTILPCQNRKKEGGFLSVPVDEFDAKFFGISGKEAEYMDPQQRLLHEVAWEAFEDAMIDPSTIRGTQTGIFVGSWIQDYKDMLSRSQDTDFFRVYMGNSIAGGAARLSHFFGTTGPSIATESGCSSAMVAVDMAVKSLRNQNSTLALACGVNLMLHPFDHNNTLNFIIAPDGRCKTFDEKANGFGRAEGCAVLLMKRFSDATRDGDKIWGLIRGSAVTQEGVSNSFGTPTVHSESLAMELALRDADVDSNEVSYVEAHGTGTTVGDPLEIAAITKAYSKGRSEPLVIGSVKTNVGHTESVSGITGIIKVLLSMKNEKIPQHLNLEVLNPGINLDLIPAMIPLEAMNWNTKQGKPRIAGINSFGISGTDCHVVIEEPPITKQNAQLYYKDVKSRPLHIMKISAKSPESFQDLLLSYSKILDSAEADAFPDIAYSANTARQTFSYRTVIIANNCKDAAKIIREKSFKQADVKAAGNKLCFLFTGQGSQYPNMASSLYDNSPIFKDQFDKCDQNLTNLYGINLRQVLWGKSSDDAELSRTLYSQTSIFCIEYCLLKLWESWGVKPDYVMGHSLGEFAAAVAADVLDFEDALMLVAERSRLIDSLPQGKMLVIKADKKTVSQLIEKFKLTRPNFWIDFAAFNSPNQTVVAGDSTMVEEFAEFCGENSLKTIMLASTHAFHSRHMEPILEDYRQVAQTVKQPRIFPNENSPKYISSFDGELTETEMIDAGYWVRHTREPVNFINACKVAQSEGCTLFLEIGPHPVLSALTMMNIPDQSVTSLPSLRRTEANWNTMLDSLSKLFLSDWHGQVDWEGFDRYYNRAKVPLPFYPFNRKSIWKKLESALPNLHPLLGKILPSASDSTIFESSLSPKNPSFIQEHVIGNTVIFPGAAFLEMCLAGGHATVQGAMEDLRKPQRPVALKNLSIVSPLAMDESEPCRLQTIVKLEGHDTDEIGYAVGVHRWVPAGSGSGGEWICHATAKFLPVGLSTKSNPTLFNIPHMKSTWKEKSTKPFYDKFPETGIRFGDNFRSLEVMWEGEDGMLVGVKIPEDDGNRYLIHPVVADAMIQATILFTDPEMKNARLKVPVQIEEFMWLQALALSSASSPSNHYIFCSSSEKGKIDSILLDDCGTVLAHMSGVEVIETSVKLVEGMIQQQTTAMPKLWREVWKNAPGPLQSAYDLRTTVPVQVLQFNREQRQILAGANNVGEGERSFYLNICKIMRLFCLNAFYELGWEPRQATLFTLEELWKLLLKPKKHIRKYIQYFLQNASETGFILIMNDPVDRTKYYFPDQPPTQQEIQKDLQRMINAEEYSSRAELQMMSQLGWNLARILKGEVDALALLFPEDPSKPNAGQLYIAAAKWMLPVLKPVNDALIPPIINYAHDSKTVGAGQVPVFRILEVGAGTGGYSQSYLDYMESLGKPFEYYFTDVSASFFNAAGIKFEKYSKQMVFKKFNLEEDSLAQGFCPKYFDMILAAEVLHVAKDMRKTLRNLKNLLKPGGIFQIIETTCPDPRTTLTFGLLEGYWQFEDLDLRPCHATLTPEKWEMILREINCDKVVCTPVYNDVNSLIAARLSPDDDDLDNFPPTPDKEGEHSWLIFYHEGNAQLAENLKMKLTSFQRAVRLVKRPTICHEGAMKGLMKDQMEDVKALEGVLYLWGLSSDRGEADREQALVSLPLLSLIQEIKELKTLPRLYVVTQGIVQVEEYEVMNPTAGTLHGMLKSLNNENTSLQLNSLDLDPGSDPSIQTDEIFHDLWGMDTTNHFIAFRDERRLCVKLVSAKMGNHEPLPLPNGYDRFQLVLPTTKLISDLEFGVLENWSVEEKEVEVKVKAVALNFRDLLTVLKPISEFDTFNSVGLDITGVVTKVGSGVTKWKVGARVIGMNNSRNLSLPTHIKMEEDSMVPLPTHLTFAEGSTLPAVFITTLYCLTKVVEMKRGDTVLIHTASGGVGLCAIQFAKHVGAHIIATAGSKKKQNYLRNLGVKHVFHSRSTHFANQILEVTDGRGVDIVLNSITGEGFKEASLSVLAMNGSFIEMSRLSIWTEEEVKQLRPDVYYQIVDLASFDKMEVQNLFGELTEFLEAGRIQPIPYERFDAVNIRGALNYLQKAKHIGKILCIMPEVKVENSKITGTTPLFNKVSTYLVTGGLGGIGLEVVKWMLSSGAKHIAIASRKPPKQEIAYQINSWNKNGHHVEAFSADIGDYDQCLQLFKDLRSSRRGFPQLRGVMHVAGVLADATLENQTWDKFNHTYNPKVNGSWNLHDLTQDLALEHFVLFSSMVSSLGTPGQSNHAASSRFEDTLAAYRRANGLPATTVNWGNWGEVGVATELDFPGIRPISTSQGILALETFLRTQTSHLCVMNVDSFSLAAKVFPNLKHYVEDKRLFGELQTTVMINSDDFWKDMDSAEDRLGKLVIFKKLIKATIRNMLKMDRDDGIDDLAEFQTLGMDSLTMLEMKNVLQNMVGSRLTVSTSMLKDCSNTDMLAKRLLESLLGEEEDEGDRKVIIPTMDELRELIRDDSVLPEHVRPNKNVIPVRELSHVENVLIFGATGVLGPYLLKELSQRPSIKKIYCLVRKIGKLTPSNRLSERLQDINMLDQVDIAKVECLQGDITEDKFGLSEEDYHRLAEDVEAVFNSAVIVDHSAKYYKAPEEKKLDVRNVNVKGTLRILEFAAQNKLKHVYHASSIAAIATTDEHGCLSEEWQDVGGFDQVTYNMGYVLSKHISEQLCRQAVERGIPCKTFRHPVIGGDSKTGRCDYLTNHVILRWLAYLKLKCMPDMPTPMVLMPVDHCARISLDIFFNPLAPPDVFNVIHKDGGMDQTIIGIANELGISIELVSFSEFVAKLKQEKDDSPLALFKKIYEDEEGVILQNVGEGGSNPTLQVYEKYLEDSSNFFGSRKLPQLIDYYDELESTEVVMRRDIQFLKEAGVFDKFGINKEE